VDGGSAQCVPGGTRLAQPGAQLEKAWPYKNPLLYPPYRQSGYKAMSSRPRKKIDLCLRPPSRLIQLRIGAG
jgi:hypothetical protein